MPTEFSQEEWDKLLEQYPPGTTVTGVVNSQEQYGVWVTLDCIPEVPALLELIHFEIVERNPENRIEFPDEYPTVGMPINCRVLAWCLTPKDVRLTQLSHLDWRHSRHLDEKKVRNDIRYE